MAFLYVLKNVTKLGIAGGAIYITLDQGIWSGPREGATNLTRLTQTIPNKDTYVRQIPSKKGVSSSFKQTWNSGVQTAFAGLAKLPDKASEGSNKLVTYMTDSSKRK